MYENARKYELTGTDAMVYEALVYLCKKSGEWKGSFAALARFSCCGDRHTAMRSLQRLLDKGLVVQNEPNVVQIAPQMVQNEPDSKEERTKEENINKEKSGVVIDHTTHTTFIDFWKIVSPDGEWKRYEKTCKKIWDTLPEDWRKLVVEKAPGVAADRNPLYYLQDEDFLQVGTDAKTPKASPEWLFGTAIDEALRAGIKLSVCKNPETGLFGTVTREEAELFGLEKLRDM